mmetsp:Transcript_22252/g.39636  ORF Transcript_22252/g.39636 Transcript_22252/m.39636 type:complete len:84 (+) Transcript_22252:484-735(+)
MTRNSTRISTDQSAKEVEKEAGLNGSISSQPRAVTMTNKKSHRRTPPRQLRSLTDYNGLIIKASWETTQDKLMLSSSLMELAH